MVCGGFEVDQQRAMLGLDPAIQATEFFEGAIASIVRSALPTVSYLADTPHGGTHPFTINEGTATYYGIGAYGRPTSDARRSGLRFATGCLAMAHIGTEDSIHQLIDRGAAIHSAQWKRSVPRDHGGSWDMEDTRDRYIPTVFGVDPMTLRRTNPDRYLDIGRATTSLLLQESITEWRTPTSRCNGALILHGRDYVAGTGCGLVDAAGRAKPAYYALRRASRPVAIALVDEGLSGLDVWIHNDTDEPISGPLRVATFDAYRVLASAITDVLVSPRGSFRVPAEQVLGGFHDITYAFQFGARQSVGVAASLVSQGHGEVRAVHVVSQPDSIVQREFELSAHARPTGLNDGEYEVVVESDGFARFVQFSGRGTVWSDQGFDLPPGSSAKVLARCDGPFRGRIRALNRTHSVAIECVQ
jgi:beta-mannosidase